VPTAAPPCGRPGGTFAKPFPSPGPSDHPSGMGAQARATTDHATDIAAVVAMLKTRSPAPIWLIGTTRRSERHLQCVAVRYSPLHWPPKSSPDFSGMPHCTAVARPIAIFVTVSAGADPPSVSGQGCKIQNVILISAAHDPNSVWKCRRQHIRTIGWSRPCCSDLTIWSVSLLRLYIGAAHMRNSTKRQSCHRA
jgi:hypothetical protein